MSDYVHDKSTAKDNMSSDAQMNSIEQIMHQKVNKKTNNKRWEWFRWWREGWID